MKIAKPIVFRNFDSTRASVATYYNSSGYVDEAGVDELRLTFNPTTLDFIGPLIEGEATNLFSYSNDFTNAVWEKLVGNAYIAIVSGIAPTGNTEALNVMVAPGGFGQFFRDIDVDGLVTISFHVKYLAGDIHALQIQGFGASGGDFVRFDAVTGAVVASSPGVTTVIQGLPNQWYRVAITGSVSSARRFEFLTFYNSPPPSAPDTKFALWGAQLEVGSEATSFIYTTSSTATRAPDIAVDEKPRVVTSNVSEADADVWDDDAAYVAGSQVMVLGHYHKVYESIGSNTNKFPADHPEEWIDQGATNRWRMFDMTVGADKQTVSDDSNNIVNVLLDIDQIANSVTLLNLDANNVRVIMRDSEGNEVYNHFEYLLQSTYESNWWSFFFATRKSTKTIVLTDLPNIQPATIEFILDGDGFPAKIGKLIVGDAVDIGCARYGTGVGIVDFSRKERDAFGNNFIVARRYIDRADFDVQIPTNRVDEVKDLLASVRATPAVYIGYEEFNSTVLYGFYRDFSIVISGPKKSDCTLQVESI